MHPEDSIGHDTRTVATRELLADYLAGNTDAGQKLFRQHAHFLLGKAKHHSGFHGLRVDVSAEDLVNEVFVRLFASGSLLSFEDRGKSSLRRLLLRILERVIIDSHRRKQAQKRGADQQAAPFSSGDLDPRDSLAERAVSPDTSPTSHARHSELLVLCKEHLSSRDFVIWEMVEVRELDSFAVAKQLGMKPEAVRGSIYRSRKKLLRILSTDDAGDVSGEQNGPGAR